MERQIHGLQFEDRIIQVHTGVSKSDYAERFGLNQSSPMDIVKGCLSPVDCSVKVSQNGKHIACADALRFFSICQKNPFTLVIGAWTKTPLGRLYYQITECDINPAYHQILWGALPLQALEELVSEIKSIAPGLYPQLQSRPKWKERRRQLCEQYKMGIMHLDVKVDSGIQRRVQCSVRMSQLEDAGMPVRISTREYRGIGLPYASN